MASELKVDKLLNGSGGSFDGSQLANVGKVLQVVSTRTKTTGSTSSSTYTDVPDMSLSITPSSANSKILVMIDAKFGHNENTQTHGTKVLRNGTFIYGTNYSTMIGGAGYSSSYGHPTGIMFVDSPSTTSQITYKLQYGTEQTIMYFNRGGDNSRFFESSIVLMEIGA